MTTPLKGIRVLEIAGLAPGPFCGMILSDFGADVIRIDRSSSTFGLDKMVRGKRSLCIDFNAKEGIEIILKMVEKSDVFIEPFRPGVAEKIGFGPEVVMKRNPRIIYARLTGWGQNGPLAKQAGHDINYIALSGALSPIARHGQPPLFPINLLGDFAGGGLLCAFGIIMALYARDRPNNSDDKEKGKGQIIDAAMIDGAAYINTFVTMFYGNGLWNLERGTNLLDSGAPFYEVYRTKDNKYVAVGAIEPPFYALLLKGLGLDNDSSFPSQNDNEKWPEMKQRFAEIFASKTRDEWCHIFDNTDACVSPVIHLDELMNHPHAKYRQLYEYNAERVLAPSPAPRLSRTPAKASSSASLQSGEHSKTILLEFGFSDQSINEWVQKRIVVDKTAVKSAL